MVGNRILTMEHRLFWKKVEKTETCWLWTAALNNSGYGAFAFEGSRWLAHRFSYFIHKGPIPTGMYVLHRCDSPRCVNPDHLWIGTQADNMRDCAEKGRNFRCYRWTSANNPNKGLPLPEWKKERVRQAKQRPFEVIGPAGEHIRGINLTHFCRVHGLNQGVMWQVIKGQKPHHKGYTKAPGPN